MRSIDFKSNPLDLKKWDRPYVSILIIKKDTFGGSDKWNEGHPNKPPKP